MKPPADMTTIELMEWIAINGAGPEQGKELWVRAARLREALAHAHRYDGPTGILEELNAPSSEQIYAAVRKGQRERALALGLPVGPEPTPQQPEPTPETCPNPECRKGWIEWWRNGRRVESVVCPTCKGTGRLHPSTERGEAK